jgi:2-dehydropantoate 2-reductase
VKVGIIGAGALGSAIGGTLVEAGHDILLVNRDRTHVEVIDRNGLVMRADGNDRVVSIRAAIPSEAGGPVDLAIVLVKSFHTAEAIRVAIGLVGPETTMLSLRNGLGHEDILSRLIGRDRVIAGKTYIGGAMLGPGHVIAGVRGKETIVGELDGAGSRRASNVSEQLSRRRACRLSSAAISWARCWDKVLVNVATGALSGITRLAYGDLYAVPELEVIATAAVAEAIAVAKASGIALETIHPHEAWMKELGFVESDLDSATSLIEPESSSNPEKVTSVVIRRILQQALESVPAD